MLKRAGEKIKVYGSFQIAQTEYVSKIDYNSSVTEALLNRQIQLSYYQESWSISTVNMTGLIYLLHLWYLYFLGMNELENICLIGNDLIGMSAYYGGMAYSV
jgi:hypothetical protein